jgi:uncharacterized protein YbjT (DUF2867 family)
MTKVFVTSGNAKTGSTAIAALAKVGDAHIVAGVRDVEKSKDNLLALGANDVIKFDFDDVSTYAPALEGVESVLYVHGVVNPFEKAEEWAQKFIEASKQAGVKFIAKVSAIGADPAAPGIIGSHGKTDQLFRDSGINFSSIKPNSFLENWFNSAASIKVCLLPPLSSGSPSL